MFDKRPSNSPKFLDLPPSPRETRRELQSPETFGFDDLDRVDVSEIASRRIIAVLKTLSAPINWYARCTANRLPTYNDCVLVCVCTNENEPPNIFGYANRNKCWNSVSAENKTQKMKSRIALYDLIGRERERQDRFFSIY